MTDPQDHPGLELPVRRDGPEPSRRIRRFSPGRDLAPFAIAAVILYYLFSGRDWETLAAAMKTCDLRLMAAGAAIFTLGHFIVNLTTLKLLFNWFITRIGWAETAKLYGASLLPQTVINSLGTIVIYVYMVGKKQAPLMPTVGVSFFYAFTDLTVMAATLSVALFLKPDQDPIVWAFYGVLVPAALAAAWYFPGRGGKRLLPFIYNLPLALPLRSASPAQSLKLFALRAAFPVFQVAGHLVALKSMGIDPPLGMLIVIVTAMTFATFLPVSAMGYGAPNLVALYLAPYVASAAAAQETALAYGLLFQTGFLIGRVLIGLIFAAPFWREAIAPALRADGPKPE